LTTELVYLIVMVAIVVVVSAVTMPSLFFKRCGKCGVRNFVDTTACKKCGEPFPAEESG
jgi:uncharacterized OB-fold protein